MTNAPFSEANDAIEEALDWLDELVLSTNYQEENDILDAAIEWLNDAEDTLSEYAEDWKEIGEYLFKIKLMLENGGSIEEAKGLLQAILNDAEFKRLIIAENNRSSSYDSTKKKSSN